jgi:hypothetical protein
MKFHAKWPDQRLLAIFAAAFLLVSSSAQAGVWDFMRGCIILGGVGIGGTALAASNSKVDIKDSQAYVVAGITSCVVGGFIAGEVVKKAEIEASAELSLKNVELRTRVYSVMHDLCVLKKTCGPDGLPLKEEDEEALLQGAAEKAVAPQSLKTGN